MQDLRTKISGNIIELREAGRDFFSLRDYFKITANHVLPHVEKLRYALEGGITEYKKTITSPLFRFLENAKYESHSMEDLAQQIQYLEGLIFVLGIQRLLALGEKPLNSAKAKVDAAATTGYSVKHILQEITGQIQQDAEARQNPQIKNILLQVAKIKKEKETLNKLLPTIKAENRQAFLQNFNATFGEIEDKIKRNYTALIESNFTPPEEQENRDQYKTVLPILNREMELFSEMRSTLVFTADEKYKIREVLIRLAAKKTEAFKLFEQEALAYKGLKAAHEQPASRLFCVKILEILEKEFNLTAGQK